MKISANYVDIKNRQIFPATLVIEDKKIKSIHKNNEVYQNYIIPGFVDAHIHIESSMLVPTEFAKIALSHGTVATVCDPHEIANVLGVEGVEYMIDNAKKSSLKFNFGAPSCVPATAFETSGATINSKDIKELLARDDISHLSEMMNYPGVIYDDAEVIAKITYAKQANKPIDGHAPGLVGGNLDKYIDAGISTDHEAYSYEEGLEKIKKGMKILIREGSAAKDFDSLIDLLKDYSDSCMFCSDDKNPNDLIKGHIDELVKRAVKNGYNKFDVLQVACINPVEHYNLDVGLLQENDKADFVVVDSLDEFNVIKTFIDGELVYEKGKTIFESLKIEIVNNFNTNKKNIEDFRIKFQNDSIKVIKAMDRELLTKVLEKKPKVVDGFVVSDLEKDILKIAVINRYKNEEVAVAFIEGFGLKSGAIASSIAHDSHNIIVVGCDDESILKAVNIVIEKKGAIVALNASKEHILELKIAGLMSDKDASTVAKQYKKINSFVKDELKSNLNSPFMTLSFMALLVIPDIKLGDMGLFDGTNFQFTNIFTKNSPE
ncbi:MAG: adenine deaminase [Sulfurimonas sp.]|jgi:adenine deaminase